MMQCGKECVAEILTICNDQASEFGHVRSCTIRQQSLSQKEMLLIVISKESEL